MADERRHVATALALLALLVPAAAASSAPPPRKVIPLNWIERVPLTGGALVVRVTRVEVAGRDWTVSAELANESDVTIRATRVEPNDFRECVTSIVRYWRVRYAYGGAWGRNEYYPRSFRPPRPRILEAGTRWRGTFSGRDALPKGKDLYVCFGYFTTAQDREGFSVVTERAFRL